MNASTILEIPDRLATEIASTDQYRLLEAVSRKSRVLAILLRGGQKANPDVRRPRALAKELLAWLRAVHDRWPLIQKEPGDRRSPEVLPEDVDLLTLLSAIGRDVRYLEHLTRGGIGMSPNMVLPIRVLETLIAKLEAVHSRWPELQGHAAYFPDPIVSAPGNAYFAARL